MRFIFLGIMFLLFGGKMMLEGSFEWWTVVSITVAATASIVCFGRAALDHRASRARAAQNPNAGN